MGRFVPRAAIQPMVTATPQLTVRQQPGLVFVEVRGSSDTLSGPQDDLAAEARLAAYCWQSPLMKKCPNRLPLLSLTSASHVPASPPFEYVAA